MIDYLAEIPISGCVPGAVVVSSAPVACSPFFAGPENRLVATILNDLLPNEADATSSQTVAPVRAASPVREIILLCGPTGTGKTHLARGICEKWQAAYDSDSALALSARQFREELIAAFDADQVDSLRQQWRSLRLLVIDDIHRLASDAYLNEELQHTIDALLASGATLLLTSAVTPGSLTNLSLAVRNRLARGTTLSLSPPGLAAREQVAKRVAASQGRQLTDAAATLIASQVTGTTNDIAGVIGEMIHGMDAPKSLSENDIGQFLHDQKSHCRPKFSDIVRVVAKHYGVPQKILKSSSRRRSVVLARGMVIYMSRELLELSFERIGRALSGRDHTTIMHSYRKIEKLAKTDLATGEAITDLRRLLNHRREVVRE